MTRLISFHLLHKWMSLIQDLNLIMPDIGITEVPSKIRPKDIIVLFGLFFFQFSIFQIYLYSIHNVRWMTHRPPTRDPLNQEDARPG